MKYLRLNLTDDVQDWHMEIYKTLFRETRDGLNKWTDISWSWL